MMTKPMRIIFSLMMILSTTIAAASHDADFEKISKCQTPAAYFEEFKTLVEKDNKAGVSSRGTATGMKDAALTLWQFRYLKGVDGQYIEDSLRASCPEVKLDDSYASRLNAWRLYFGHIDNGHFYAKHFSWVAPLTTLLATLESILQLPSKVPEGSKLVYGVFSRVVCGGEFGPVCPSTTLATSLPKTLRHSHPEGIIGLVLTSSVNLFTSFALGTMTQTTTKECEYDVNGYLRDGYRSVSTAKSYLKQLDRARSKQRNVFAVVGVVTAGSSYIWTSSVLQRLTGTVTNSMRTITEYAYNQRSLSSDCFQLIDKITALPCNLTLPFDYLKDADFYVASTRVMQATVIDALPYMIPLFITWLQYMILVTKLF